MKIPPEAIGLNENAYSIIALLVWDYHYKLVLQLVGWMDGGSLGFENN
jgi:hypothetical protein